MKVIADNPSDMRSNTKIDMENTIVPNSEELDEDPELMAEIEALDKKLALHEFRETRK